MAKRLIGVPLDPGGPVVLAEVDDADAVAEEEAFARAADATAQLEETGRSVQEALDSVVMPTARTVMDRLQKLSPDGVELEFGLKLSGTAGIVFASAQAEGHLTVKVSWQPKQQLPPTVPGALAAPDTASR